MCKYTNKWINKDANERTNKFLLEKIEKILG